MEREQSQKLPGKGRCRAKFRKKRGVGVGRDFPPQPSCQSTNPLYPRVVSEANRDGLCPQPPSEAMLSSFRVTGQWQTQRMAIDKWPE